MSVPRYRPPSPYLRRYAPRADRLADNWRPVCSYLPGDDLAEPDRIKKARRPQGRAFPVFHDAWDIVDSAIPKADGEVDENGITRQLAALPSIEAPGAAVIALERVFNRGDARILGIDDADGRAQARRLRGKSFADQFRPGVLIIEDETGDRHGHRGNRRIARA